ncbi:MAG: LSM domain-containing protein [Thermoplasmata archaeon]|nr:LSM domain-containing protein [Thermoplasmata archaeon]
MGTPPTVLLERLLAQRVTLRLKDNRVLEGRLAGIDEHLNVVLDDVAESSTTINRHFPRVVLRGSNVTALYAPSGLPSRPA